MMVQDGMAGRDVPVFGVLIDDALGRHKTQESIDDALVSRLGEMRYGM